MPTVKLFFYLEAPSGHIQIHWHKNEKYKTIVFINKPVSLNLILVIYKLLSILSLRDGINEINLNLAVQTLAHYTRNLMLP